LKQVYTTYNARSEKYQKTDFNCTAITLNGHETEVITAVTGRLVIFWNTVPCVADGKRY